MEAEPTHWQCDCGAWVPIGFSRHTHVKERAMSLEELVAARENGTEPFATELSWVWRSGEHRVR